ncbi:MAG TPA: SIS domain-containing protein [Gaiellaceae bacterium]|nr:SIS domain-containing protein [Gaiellaceae bacterium]
MSTNLERELREQPEALARLLDQQRSYAERVAELFRREDVDYVLIASRGSSSNAARYAQYLLGRAHRVPVSFATPSLFTLYHQPPRLDGALVIGISQSGESPDVVEVLAEARRQGRPTVALTNTPGSPLGRLADGVLKLEAGDERAVAATKTYVNSLGAVALLFSVLTDDRAARDELAHVPAQLARQIERSWEESDAIGRLGDIGGGTVVSRGINYCTAFEIALKIRELSGLLFEPFSAADLMHGPVAAISAGWPVIAVAPSGPALAQLEQAIDEVARRGARFVVISDAQSALARGEVALPLDPGVPEWLSPLVAVVPGQLAALRLARLRGVDLDAPLGLSKVTLTT